MAKFFVITQGGDPSYDYEETKIDEFETWPEVKKFLLDPNSDAWYARIIKGVGLDLESKKLSSSEDWIDLQAVRQKDPNG